MVLENGHQTLSVSSRRKGPETGKVAPVEEQKRAVKQAGARALRAPVFRAKARRAHGGTRKKGEESRVETESGSLVRDGRNGGGSQQGRRALAWQWGLSPVDTGPAHHPPR